MTETNETTETTETTTEKARKRGRPRSLKHAGIEAQPTRADQVKTERRRRHSLGYDANLRFSLPPHLKNDPEWRYHWLVDRPGRIAQKTRHDDWDFVEDAETQEDGRNSGAGTRIERHAGVDQFGNPLRAFLVRKKREYDNEDRREQQKALDARMAAIKGGRVTNPEGRDLTESGEFYTPRGSIQIRENNT